MVDPVQIKNIPVERTTLDGTEYLLGQLAAGGAASTVKFLPEALVETTGPLFNDQNGITVVPSTVTDGAGLQALIDARQAAGGGVVRLNHTVPTTQTITIPDKTTLSMGPRGQVEVTADVHGIELRGSTLTYLTDWSEGSGVTGGRIWINTVGYTKAALFLDGRRIGSGSARFHRQANVQVKGLTIQGRNGGNAGTGILLQSIGDASNGGSVQWVDFANINIIDFHDGVHMNCYEGGDGTFVSFINGNTFRSIFMQDCVNFWHYTCDGAGGGAAGDASLNQIIGSTYQVSTATEKMILVDGTASNVCRNNYYFGLGCFDWNSAPAASPIAIDLADGVGWLIMGVGDVDLDECVFIRNSNTIMFGSPSDIGSYFPTTTNSSGPTQSAALEESRFRLWRSEINANLALMMSDGQNWRPIVGTGGSRVNYTNRQVTLTPLDLISRSTFAQNVSEGAGIPTVFGLTQSSVGSEVHISRRSATEPVYIFSPNTAFTNLVFDNFAGTQSTGGQLLRLDSQFAETIVRVLENSNLALQFKRGTLSFQSVNQGTKAYNPGSIAPAGTEVTTVTVTGALVGHNAYAFHSMELKGVVISATVTAPDTVEVTFTNPTAAAVDIASGNLYALAIP